MLSEWLCSLFGLGRNDFLGSEYIVSCQRIDICKPRHQRHVENEVGTSAGIYSNVN